MLVVHSMHWLVACHSLQLGLLVIPQQLHPVQMMVPLQAAGAQLPDLLAPEPPPYALVLEQVLEHYMFPAPVPPQQVLVDSQLYCRFCL